MIATYILVVTLLAGPVTTTTQIPVSTISDCIWAMPNGIGEAIRIYEDGNTEHKITKITIECRPRGE